LGKFKFDKVKVLMDKLKESYLHQIDTVKEDNSAGLAVKKVLL